ALGRIERFLDRADDLGDCHLGGFAGEVITATRAADAFHERAPAQLAEELLQVRQRDLLALADAGQRHETVCAVQREVQHGGDRETALGGKLHGNPLYPTIILNYCSAGDAFPYPIFRRSSWLFADFSSSSRRSRISAKRPETSSL